MKGYRHRRLRKPREYPTTLITVPYQITLEQAEAIRKGFIKTNPWQRPIILNEMNIETKKWWKR